MEKFKEFLSNETRLLKGLKLNREVNKTQGSYALTENCSKVSHIY